MKTYNLIIITSVGGTLFSFKRKGLKRVKTKGTKNSLKAGPKVAVPPGCRVNYGFDWTELLEEKGWEIPLMVVLKPVR